MPTTKRDAQALTYLAGRLRDETQGANHWDEAGIWAKVSKLEGQHLATAIEQVTRHAADPTAKTPGAIGRPFLPDPPERRTDLPPRKNADRCPKHYDEWRHACRSCAAEAKGAADYDDEPTTGWTPAEVRAALRPTPDPDTAAGREEAR